MSAQKKGGGRMRPWRVSALAVVAAAALQALPAGAAAPQPAPAFTLRLLDGGTLTQADLKGSAAVLLFWAPW